MACRERCGSYIRAVAGIHWSDMDEDIFAFDDSCVGQPRLDWALDRRDGLFKKTKDTCRISRICGGLPFCLHCLGNYYSVGVLISDKASQIIF